MPDKADDLSRQLYERVRRGVLRRILRTDAEMSELFDRFGTRLRRRFRLLGMTEEDVRKAVAEEFRAVEEELIPIVERDLETAAADGDEAARKTLERIRALDAEGRNPFAPTPASQAQDKPVLRLLKGSGGRSPGTG